MLKVLTFNTFSFKSGINKNTIRNQQQLAIIINKKIFCRAHSSVLLPHSHMEIYEQSCEILLKNIELSTTSRKPTCELGWFFEADIEEAC